MQGNTPRIALVKDFNSHKGSLSEAFRNPVKVSNTDNSRSSTINSRIVSSSLFLTDLMITTIQMLTDIHSLATGPIKTLASRSSNNVRSNKKTSRY